MVVGKIVSRVAFSMAMTVTARSGPVKPGHWVNLLRHTSLRAGRQPSTYTHVRLGLPARSRLVWLATCPSACAKLTHYCQGRPVAGMVHAQVDFPSQEDGPNGAAPLAPDRGSQAEQPEEHLSGHPPRPR